MTATKSGHKRASAVTLTPADRQALEGLFRKGVCPVRVLNRARILLFLDDNRPVLEIERLLHISHGTIWRIGVRYKREGLEGALFERPRPGKVRLLDEAQTQRFVAMICSPPPDGRARWTIRLAAEEAVRRGICPTLARETARILMKHHDLKPWREKNVVRRKGRHGIPLPDGRRSGDVRTSP